MCFFREDLQNHVKVVVGPTQTKLWAPASLLTYHSEYFKKQREEKNHGGGIAFVQLPDQDPEAVAIFFTFIYTGSIDNAKLLQEATAETSVLTLAKIRPIWVHLVNCFLLGEFIGAHGFNNIIADRTITTLKTHQLASVTALAPSILPTVKDIKRIWNATGPRSPLRRIVTDYLHSQPKADGFIGIFPDDQASDFFVFMKDLALEAIQAIQAKRDPLGAGRSYYEKDKCNYHQHPGKPHGYSCTLTQGK